MRLLISKTKTNYADYAFTQARSAKRVLRESPVTTLMLSQNLVGRESGLELLKWANSHDVLPVEVILIDSNPLAVKLLGDFLQGCGFRPFNNRHFVKRRMKT